MALKLGTTTASLYLGSTPVAAYLGATEVYSPANDTSLLLNFNGANGSTAFTDSSGNSLTVTANGDAEISTAEFKFGGASLYCAQEGDYLSVDADAAIDLGDGDFTIEFWSRFAQQAATYAALIGNNGGWGSGAFVFGFDRQFAAEDSQKMYVAGNGLLSPETTVGTTTYSYDTWRHVAVTRTGGALKIWVGGQLEITASMSGSLNLGRGGEMLVMRSFDGPDGQSVGYMDDLRIVKGVALYTDTFTPPTAQLGVV
jgi:hypothetical protein